MDKKELVAASMLIAISVSTPFYVGYKSGQKAGFTEGAIAAYKRQIVCAEVPQLNRAAEWQCKEVER